MVIENNKEKLIATYTLGCKLNFAETSTLSNELQKWGMRRALSDEVADIILVNTCSVTELSDKKCRQTIRKAIKKNPKAFVVVTGCYAQLKPTEIAQIEGVDLILGAEHKGDILSYISKEFQKKETPLLIHTERKEIHSFAPSCSQGERTRCFLKVQDGCDYFCSYCTIPLARGKSRNGSIASIIEQANAASEKGAKEIILTGVNIGDFGKSTNETFFDLIRALDEVEGIERFRISSIEPNLLTDEIIAWCAQSKRFAPHFHIPLQSGCDAVLKLMKRRYDTELFKHKVDLIKQYMPNAFIGVDVIIGTRGETESYFEETFQFLETLDFTQLHVFSYSERPNTQALKIEHVVSSQEKHERSQRLLDLSEQKTKAFYLSQQNSKHKVLFEQPKVGHPMHGFTDNYLRVECEYKKDLVNHICEVTLGNYMERVELPALECIELKKIR